MEERRKFRYKVEGRKKLLYDSDNEFGYLQRNRELIAGSTGTIFVVEREMQYSGKRSKFVKGNLSNTGEELYESDIVKHQNGFLYVLEYSNLNLKWVLVAPKKSDGANNLEELNPGAIDGQDIWRCERIGNLFENPTLLKHKVLLKKFKNDRNKIK